MKTHACVVPLLALALTAGTAAAQPAHWRIASKDVEANKKLFVAMGGRLLPGANPVIKLDEPVRKVATGSTITFITDPWEARIELVERAPAVQ